MDLSVLSTFGRRPHTCDLVLEAPSPKPSQVVPPQAALVYGVEGCALCFVFCARQEVKEKQVLRSGREGGGGAWWGGRGRRRRAPQQTIPLASLRGSCAGKANVFMPLNRVSTLTDLSIAPAPHAIAPSDAYAADTTALTGLSLLGKPLLTAPDAVSPLVVAARRLQLVEQRLATPGKRGGDGSSLMSSSFGPAGHPLAYQPQVPRAPPPISKHRSRKHRWGAAVAAASHLAVREGGQRAVRSSAGRERSSGEGRPCVAG